MEKDWYPKLGVCVLAGLCVCAMSGCGKAVSNQQAEQDIQQQNSENIQTEAEFVFRGVEQASKEEQERYALSHGADAFCVDSDRGGMYYVNWAGDKYLYYWDGERTKLLCDKWVSQICYQDGKVYCLYDKTGKTYRADRTPSYEGVICSIDVLTGEFTVLSKKKADTLTVTKDGLYWLWSTGPEEEVQVRKYWMYSFEDGSVKKIKSTNDSAIAQERYGKYAIIIDFTGITTKTFQYFGTKLRDLETGEEQVLFTETERPILGYVIEHYYAYKLVDENQKVTWNMLDLFTGEKKELNLENPETITKFLKFGDLFYAVNGRSGEVVVYDPQRDQMKTVVLKNTCQNVHMAYIMDKFKTDGTYLYTVPDSGEALVLSVDGYEVSEFWSCAEEKMK